jgi:transketolase
MNASVRKQSVLRLLQMHFESGVGHLGGNLSALDVLLTLYHDVLSGDDQFVLSKGHAAGALYVTLWSLGRLCDEELRTFHRDDTRLAGHPPPRGLDEVLFATGSLGHGLGLSAGLALGRRLQKRPGRVFCLTSDGEWNEGSTWEALIFAQHHQLTNLTFIVDLNGLQGFGSTREVADLSPLADKLRTFGVRTLEIDGHDTTQIEASLRTVSDEGPLAVVARTVKGRGVSSMENQMQSHYLPLTAAQYQQAVREVDGR